MISQGELVAFFSLLNGMIGGTILVLPLLSLQTGYLLIPLISTVYGTISYYTCNLLVSHIGNCHSIKQSILEHFNNKKPALIGYNVTISLGIIGLLIAYFHLIITQLQGFLPQGNYLPVFAMLLLICLTVLMRYCKFGEKLLAIGILSIVGYLGFIAWAIVTGPKQPNTLLATGPNYIDLAASLTLGYSIHDFVVQILLKTTTPDKYHRVVVAVYLAGVVIYTCISYGGYAIVNRVPRVPNPQTISEYFPLNGWQVLTIKGLYLFHLLSASPQFCIIMRVRILQIFEKDQQDQPGIIQRCNSNYQAGQHKEEEDREQQGEENGKKGQEMSVAEMGIYIGMYLLCYVLYVSKIKIATIIELNGSILGFMYVFFVPIALHIRCVYFSSRGPTGEIVVKQLQPNGEVVQRKSKCKCQLSYQNKYTKIGQLVLQVVVFGIGVFTMIYTLKTVFWGTEGETNTEL